MTAYAFRDVRVIGEQGDVIRTEKLPGMKTWTRSASALYDRKLLQNSSEMKKTSPATGTSSGIPQARGAVEDLQGGGRLASPRTAQAD